MASLDNMPLSTRITLASYFAAESVDDGSPTAEPDENRLSKYRGPAGGAALAVLLAACNSGPVVDKEAREAARGCAQNVVKLYEENQMRDGKIKKLEDGLSAAQQTDSELRTALAGRPKMPVPEAVEKVKAAVDQLMGTDVSSLDGRTKWTKLIAALGEESNDFAVGINHLLSKFGYGEELRALKGQLLSMIKGSPGLLSASSQSLIAVMKLLPEPLQAAIIKNLSHNVGAYQNALKLYPTYKNLLGHHEEWLNAPVSSEAEGSKRDYKDPCGTNGETQHKAYENLSDDEKTLLRMIADLEKQGSLPQVQAALAALHGGLGI